MYMCMLLWGALHGLVLLPVLLSFIGELGTVLNSRIQDYETVLHYILLNSLNNKDSTDTCTSTRIVPTILIIQGIEH